jgi:cellulose synthase (UDP-forming)
VRFIQDRTVIEDTESSIDLVARGWTLENYPATLAYSATPPDYGALVVQRRRWANGGLIILPKFLRTLVRGRHPGGVPSAALRLHYLVSIAGNNVGLLLVLCYGFPGVPVSPWLPVTALGYVTIYTRDLLHLGYRASDVVRVYALNILLLPVNLAGVLTSLHQAVKGTKIPFERTPKVNNRTAVQRVYLLFPLALIGSGAVVAAVNLIAGRPAHALFVATNIAFLAYALMSFVGRAALVADLFRVRSPSRA